MTYNNSNNNIIDKINNKDLKKNIYRNNDFKNNIKILKNSPHNKKFPIDFYMNTFSNNNITSKNRVVDLQKIQINKFLCFSSKKSPVKTNLRLNKLENNYRDIKNNENKNIMINNLSSHNLINKKNQNRSGNNIFK